jgi:hypothetical protein
MEIIVLIAILVAGVAVYYNTRSKPTKTSNEAPYKVEAPSVLDVNKDGEVNVQDAIAVIDKTVAAAKVLKKKLRLLLKKLQLKKHLLRKLLRSSNLRLFVQCK